MASEKETLDDKKPDEVMEEQRSKDKEKEEESSVQGKEEEKKTVEAPEKEEKEAVDEMEVDKKDVEEEKTVKKGKKKEESTEEEPVTPISRPTRERKTVERYSVPSEARSSTPKPLAIKKVPF